jgi:hypothetical protein
VSEKQKREYRAEAERVMIAGQEFIRALPQRSAEDLERYRRMVPLGICPLCEKRGLKMVAAHTVRAHGLDSHQLRELLGFKFSESIIDPSLSMEIASRPCLKAFGKHPNFRRASPMEVHEKISRAGRAARELNGLRLAKEQTPEQRSRAGRLGAEAGYKNGRDRLADGSFKPRKAGLP